MNLAAVMEEIGARLDTIAGLRVYRYPPDNVQVPAAVVTYPEEYPFDAAYARGMDRLTLPVVVMVGKVSDRASRDQLGAYCNGSGPSSIKAVIEHKPFSSHLALPGVSGAYASTPDHADLDATGDVDLRADVALDDWTPAAVQRLVSKYTGGGAPPSDRSYTLGVTNGTGTLRFGWSDGTTERTVSSTIPPVVANGARLGVRAALDVDNGAGGHTVTFYTSPDFVAWSQLGATTNAGAFTTSIVAGAALLEIGTRGGGTIEPMAGKVFAAEVRQTIFGVTVANPDFTTHLDGVTSFVDSTGKTWTVNGTASIEGDTVLPYTAFDSARVMGVEFDIVSMAAVEYVAATFNIDIAGQGA